MNIPTPRVALKRLLARLDQTIDQDGPVPAWLDSYCTADDAKAACQQGMNERLARWGSTAAPAPGENLPPNYIDPEHTGQDRELLEVFYRACNAEGGTADEIHLRGLKAVLAACSAAPPSPEPPAEALAARPLLEQVAAMADCIGAQTVGQITAISSRAAAWLRDNPPGRLVAIEPRGCPTPGACSCVEPTPPAPELGEVPSDKLMEQWKEECKRLSLESDYAIPASSFMAQRVVAWARQQQATELAALRKPPHPTFLDAIRLAQGCHDYSGGHSGQQGEAFQDGVGTVVAVLKKAAVGPWDSQAMAVFAIGSAPQAGEGEA